MRFTSIANTVILGAGALISTLTSCADQDFDWDKAHAVEKIEKFTYVFVNEFGKPEDGHQWGFDAADYAMGSGEYPGLTRAVIKQDNGSPRPYVLYTPPANITQKEHDEVFAWFSNHRVTWEKTPAYFDDSKNYDVAKTRNIVGGIARVISSDYSRVGYGSLVNHTSNPLGDYTIDDNIGFSNAWIQHVNSNMSQQTVKLDDPNNPNGNYTAKVTTATQMNYLYSWGLLYDGTYGWQAHLNDFNAGNGYGWGKQSSDGTVDDAHQNAILVTDASMNIWSYESAMGSSRRHDKYYIVYLEGDDYAGWYLGFDFESWGYNTNERVYGDGICNDWIIKISDVGNATYQNSRIMCEDLGGNAGITSTDIDYNDIVLDVDYEDRNNGASKVTLTLQAAGGTLPLAVFYESKNGCVKLFEVHEFFKGYTNQFVTEKDYRTMINTVGSQSMKYINSNVLYAKMPTKQYRLFFKTNDGYNQGNNAKNWSYFDEVFSLGKLKIKVYRQGIKDYLSGSATAANEAEWVNLNNVDGEAPLKICVPQRDKNGKSVQWLQERLKITDGYLKFTDWVANSLILFWEESKNTQNLY